jgi:hypothetical protein
MTESATSQASQSQGDSTDRLRAALGRTLDTAVKRQSQDEQLARVRDAEQDLLSQLLAGLSMQFDSLDAILVRPTLVGPPTPASWFRRARPTHTPIDVRLLCQISVPSTSSPTGRVVPAVIGLTRTGDLVAVYPRGQVQSWPTDPSVAFRTPGRTADLQVSMLPAASTDGFDKYFTSDASSSSFDVRSIAQLYTPSMSADLGVDLHHLIVVAERMAERAEQSLARRQAEIDQRASRFRP